MNDLPLFTWTPPAPATAQVIPFPGARRVGKVRRTAEMLAKKNGRAADFYWRQVITAMRDQMTAAGIPDDDVQHELRSFADAVFSQMHGRPRQPGGDAA